MKYLLVVRHRAAGALLASHERKWTEPPGTRRKRRPYGLHALMFWRVLQRAENLPSEDIERYALGVRGAVPAILKAY
jgi:hypothetical protein